MGESRNNTPNLLYTVQVENRVMDRPIYDLFISVILEVLFS